MPPAVVAVAVAVAVLLILYRIKHYNPQNSL